VAVVVGVRASRVGKVDARVVEAVGEEAEALKVEKEVSTGAEEEVVVRVVAEERDANWFMRTELSLSYS
jgi:hypothetical protein